MCPRYRSLYKLLCSLNGFLLFCFTSHKTTKLTNDENLEDLRRHRSLYKCQIKASCFYLERRLSEHEQNFKFPVGHDWAEITLSPSFEITTSQILCGGLENVTRTRILLRIVTIWYSNLPMRAKLSTFIHLLTLSFAVLSGIRELPNNSPTKFAKVTIIRCGWRPYSILDRMTAENCQIPYILFVLHMCIEQTSINLS